MTQMYGNKQQSVSQASEKPQKWQEMRSPKPIWQPIDGEGLSEAVASRRCVGHASTWPQYAGECGGPAGEE